MVTTVQRGAATVGPKEASRRILGRLDRIPMEARDGDLLWDLVAQMPFDGGTLRLGAGRYFLHDDMLIDRPNLEIVGHRNAVIDVQGHQLTIEGDGSGVRGCTLTGELDARYGALVLLRGTRSYLDGCWIQSSRRSIHMRRDHARVERCVWPMVGLAALIYGQGGYSGFCITGNRMNGNRAPATDLIFVDHPASPSGTAFLVLIDNNWVDARITYPVAETTYGDNVATPNPL